MKASKELEKNKFKIISNPFKRRIEYENWSANDCDWIKPAETSDFRKPEYINAALYHKAYDIIKTAQESYAGNVGLEIFFEGAPEEFNDLTNIVGKYFPENDINIIKSQWQLHSVKEVKRDIDHIFRNINDMFSKFQSNPAIEQIKKYEDVMSDTIPICVMGLYSTGKSAFINSLLGVEILPSADDPTTAKTFKISIGPKHTDYAIKFFYQDEITEKKAIKIEFKGDKFSFNCDKNIDIISKLDEIEKYDSAYNRMYHALSIINSYDRNYSKTRKTGSKPWRVSPLIEVTIPLDKKYTVLPVDEYDFVIYDTPGSDADKDDDIKVLKEAMAGQTNGLPIYVVTSDQMDKKSHSDLITILKELGDALDRNNLMIAVNKADDPDIKTLALKKKNFNDLAVSDLNPAGTYFVSSIMGLGSKLLMTNRFEEVEEVDEETGEEKIIKKPIFIDSHYWQIFRKNKSDFISIKNPKALYLFNILPMPEYDEYKTTVHDKEINQRILYNSGLDSIGFAIYKFAETYSIYNKCRNASGYLSKALIYLNDEIENKKKEKDKNSLELSGQMSCEQNRLIKKLESSFNDQKELAEKSLADSLSNKNVSNKATLKNSITERVKIIKISFGLFELNKKDKFKSKMEAFLREKLNTQFESFKEIAENKWPDVQAIIKDALIKIIVDEPILTQEQKDILQSQIQTINVTPNFSWKVNIDPQNIVSGILWIKVKEEELDKKCHQIFDEETAKSRSKISTDWSNTLDTLRDELLNEAKNCISKHNPELLKYQSQINMCISEIKSLNNQMEIINHKIDEINKLTEFFSVEKNEE
ncbi:dynamin family protein [Ruminococcus sp.]|uniref:dynamin family protein n=1 Tax=Ruminococcus sp. TaxID=41978 RepID=UPI0025EB68CE|nr:dynamin family protein [Ruminococcus sp.]